MFKFKFSFSQWKIVCSAVVALLFSVLAVSDLQAQMTTAALSGTATDATGAVVVGVKIQAKNVATGITYSAVTDGQGRYSIAELPVGTYDVSSQKSGFQKEVQTGIVLTVGAQPVLDFGLKVGRADEVVEVRGQTSSVETTTATVGQLVSPNQMADLPLNGRNFTDLLALAPGVVTVPASPGGGGQSSTVYGTQTNYSVSGSRPEGLQYLLDGTDIRDALDHGAGISVMGTSLGMEAIQEFSILTNTYSAEFGGTGAAINAVTKSGTNDVHGSAYEFIRNSAMDAANYFDVPGEKPTFKRNQFGVSMGGPIKKDKAFFFGNYEGLRSGTGQTSRGVAPTSLSDLFTDSGFTPSGTGWEGLYGPMPTVVQNIFSAYPLAQSASQCPNVTNIEFEAGTGLYCSKELQIGNEDYVLGRVDYTLSPKDSLFARYTRESAYQVLPYVLTQLPGFPEIDNEHNQYVTIGERHTLSQKILNEAQFGLVRLFTQTGNGPNVAALQSAPGVPDLDFEPAGGLSNLGPSPTNPSRPVTNRFSVSDDVIMSLGAHSLRIGAAITRVDLNQTWDQYPGGAWIFANLNGGIFPDSGLGGSLYGDPLLCVCGAGTDYSYTTPNGTSYPFTTTRYWRQTWLNPYIQDDWKISKRLTINLGVRYEWASNPTTVHGPIFTINNLTAPTTTEFDFVTAPHPFNSNPNLKNIDPRVGLAFDPFADHKTSIRAGFAMYHEPVTARTYALDNTSFAPNAPLFFLLWDSDFPNLPNSPTQPVGNPVTGFVPASSEIGWYYSIQNNVDTSPYVMQYNLTVQRQLGGGTVLTVGYNGSAGAHMFYWIDANPPISYSMAASAGLLNATNPTSNLSIAQTFAPTAPTGQGAPGTVTNPFVGLHQNQNFGSVESVEPKAHSNYNSLQVSLTRQFARDLAGNIGYTWSKCLDDASATISTEEGEWAVEDPWNPSADRGRCSFSSNQVLTANALYRLPFHANRAVSGWQISPIVSRYAGLPFNLQNQFGGDYQSQIAAATAAERPELVPGCDPMTKKRGEWFNPECFVLAPFGTISNLGRDALSNPNFFNLDFALMKDTKLTERVSMQLRAEFFDVMNHPNFLAGGMTAAAAGSTSQVYLFGTAGTVNPTNANYSQISNPAAYVLPTSTSAGGAICNPSGAINAIPVGPCYLPSTALAETVPSSVEGAERQIQFAVKLTF